MINLCKTVSIDGTEETYRSFVEVGKEFYYEGKKHVALKWVRDPLEQVLPSIVEDDQYTVYRILKGTKVRVKVKNME